MSFEESATGLSLGSDDHETVCPTCGTHLVVTVREGKVMDVSAGDTSPIPSEDVCSPLSPLPSGQSTTRPPSPLRWHTKSPTPPHLENLLNPLPGSVGSLVPRKRPLSLATLEAPTPVPTPPPPPTGALTQQRPLVSTSSLPFVSALLPSVAYMPIPTLAKPHPRRPPYLKRLRVPQKPWRPSEKRLAAQESTRKPSLKRRPITSPTSPISPTSSPAQSTTPTPIANGVPKFNIFGAPDFASTAVHRVTFDLEGSHEQGYGLPVTFIPRLYGGRDVAMSEVVKDSEDIVLSGMDGINVRIMWPGYDHIDWVRPIQLVDNQGRRMTRGQLANEVVRILWNFFEVFSNESLSTPNKGEVWTIGHPNGKWTMDNILLVSLCSVNGNTFQPELELYFHHQAKEYP